jgi:hypothetical protein
MIILLLAGCSKPSVELTAWQHALREADNQILSVTTQTHEELKENTAILREIKETLEAAQVKSESSTGKEVIQSEDTAEGNIEAHTTNVTSPASEPSAVPLVVSNAPFYCPPCERLKADVDAGKFAGFDVRFADDWKPRRYPAIRYQTPLSSTGWSVVYGYDDTTIDTLKRLTGGEPVGSIFPNRTDGAITSQRDPVRSFSRWESVSWWTTNLSRKTFVTRTHQRR